MAARPHRARDAGRRAKMGLTIRLMRDSTFTLQGLHTEPGLGGRQFCSRRDLEANDDGALKIMYGTTDGAIYESTPTTHGLRGANRCGSATVPRPAAKESRAVSTGPTPPAGATGCRGGCGRSSSPSRVRARVGASRTRASGRRARPEHTCLEAHVWAPSTRRKLGEIRGDRR